MADQLLIVSAAVMQRLSTLRTEAKFHPRPECFYPGAPTEEIRQEAEAAVNAMLDRLLNGVAKSPRKSFVLTEFQEMLNGFEQGDTEEREEICMYCDRVMDVLGIKSSDGLLNTWLYGFDPDQK